MFTTYTTLWQIINFISSRPWCDTHSLWEVSWEISRLVTVSGRAKVRLVAWCCRSWDKWWNKKVRPSKNKPGYELYLREFPKAYNVGFSTVSLYSRYPAKASMSYKPFLWYPLINREQSWFLSKDPANNKETSILHVLIRAKFNPLFQPLPSTIQDQGKVNIIPGVIVCII